ncbi:MAG: precorrin-8X methylmutase [Granulosicoccus sp.]|nr:precorrin-8X methylmutase [Granulosicoccus sp.]
MDEYLKDPIAIEEKSFAMIKAASDLSGFDEEQQQVVMRLIHTCGNPEIVENVRISEQAVSKGVAALVKKSAVLCDVEMVRNGLTKRFLEVAPSCFLNQPNVAETARLRGESRTMCALDHWKGQVEGAIAIIGNAPTALYRLMEMIEQGNEKPALIIGIPVGFVGAAESKNYLWRHHEQLGVECITILGRTGGSALAAGAFNTLVRLQRGLRF